MRLEIKALLHSAQDVESKDSLKFQYILLERPIHDQFTGEKIRTDFYPATIFNEKINSKDVEKLIGKKVTCVCYLNSQESKTEDKTYYNLRLKVTELKELTQVGLIFGE